ncbi:MAG: helix-turn-helix domain-containing protein [Verrucomicrobiales bacterium]|nr:helix-turn-helix domain-containing protein [Verrucomicrobiales bacterium]
MNANHDESPGAKPIPTDRAPHCPVPGGMQLPDGSEILNKAEVARRLGVTERHIEHLIRARRIPHLRLGAKALRFVWADVVRAFTVPCPSTFRPLS